MYIKPEYRVMKIGIKYVVLPPWLNGKGIYDVDNFFWSYFRYKATDACRAINDAIFHAWNQSSLNHYYENQRKSV